MHIFSKSLAATVVAVVEMLDRILFISTVCHHKPVSNQSNQQSVIEQNAAIVYEKNMPL